MKFAGETCTKELQALFDCLKKWEYDNLPCVDFNRDYMACVDRTYKANKEFAEAAKKVRYLFHSISNSFMLTLSSTSLTGFTWKRMKCFRVCLTVLPMGRQF